jgi:hypothetical protein
VSDKNGVILSLNEEACRSFQKEGGAKLVGSNMLDCHPEPSRSKLKAMMDGRRKNIYTIQKNGVKKLVFQTPWSLDGEYAGLAEIVFEIPWEMPHFIRDQKKD